MNQVKDRGYCVLCGKLRKQKYIQETNMYEDKSIIMNVALDDRIQVAIIDLRAHKTCYKDLIKTNSSQSYRESLIKYHPTTRNAITLKTSKNKTLYIDYD